MPPTTGAQPGRGAPMMYPPPNGYPAQYMMPQQQALRAYPLGTTTAPIPPFTAVGRGQALHTTFPSRMKAGTTTLLLPMEADTVVVPGLPGRPRNEPLPGRSAQPSRSAARYVTYREDVSEPEDEEQSDAAEEAKSEEEAEEEEEEKKYYLGQPPPGNKVVTQPAVKTKHEYFNDNDMAKAADHREYLVPIKIELKTREALIRDVFTWNRNEKLTSPRQFAKIFLQDLDLSFEEYGDLIAASIEQQIQDAHVADIEVGPSAGGPWSTSAASQSSKQFAAIPERERQKDARQWDWGLRETFYSTLSRKRQKMSHPNGKLNGHARADENASDDADVLATEDGERLDIGEPEDDLRVIVDYEVQILRHQLRDRLEWDLCSPLTPERFADQISKDMGLSGEARPLIANAVREQLLNHKRVAIDMDLLGSGTAYDSALKEIEAAREAEAEAQRRKLAGLPPLLAIPPRMRQEMASASASGLTTGITTPAADATGTNVPGTPAEPAEGDERARAGSALSDLPSEITRRTSRRFQSPTEEQEEPRPEMLLPRERRRRAEAIISDLVSRGPRPLQGAWRDWAESRSFGPLLEMLTEEELEKIEDEAKRAGRRMGRDTQRFAGRRSRPGR